MARSCCIAVLSGARSGSSCVAGVLHTLGVPMGDNLVGGSVSNPLGHFEDQAFRDIHGKMIGDWRHPTLQTKGHLTAYRELIREREALPLWGVKDPRLALVFPVFRRTLKKSTELRVIEVCRPLEQSAISLVQRAERERNVPHLQVTEIEAAEIVVRYHEAVKEALEVWGGPYLAVWFDDLVHDPRQAVQGIADFCGVGFNEKAVGLVQPGLKHL